MLFSRRELVRITLPLIIQQVLSVTIGMVDSMMVSNAGEAAVSGVSLVGTLDVLLIIAFSSLVTGGSVVVSQNLGKKNMELVQESAKQLIYAAFGVALLLTTVVLAVRKPLLSLLFGHVEADVMDSALRYFFFMALSFPFLALDNAGAALFRSMGNSMVTMLVSFMMNIINVIGNAVLIFGFHLGAAGAAISTLFSRIVGALTMLILLHNKKNLFYLEKLFHYRPDIGIIKNILRIGIPSGLESCMFQFGKLMTQSLISSMGTAAIAANAVANSLANLQYMPGTAIGHAMVTVVGRCVGAGEKKQAKKYSRILLGVAYLMLWTVVLVTCLFSRQIIGLYDLSPDSAGIANRLILYHALTAAVMWPIAFVLPHTFRAASDAKFPMLISAFSMWTFRVALSYVFALESVTVFGVTFPGLGMGIMGVWVAMTVDWVFRTVVYAVRYFSGRWLKKYHA